MASSHEPDLQRFLDRLTSRSSLTNDEQQAVLDLPCHAVQVRANHDFVLLGERVDHVSLMVAGMVGRFALSANGDRQITAMHIAGDIADLHSVVQPGATSALQALAVSTILRIPHRAIRTASASFPALAEAFWRDCTVDSAILSQWVINVGRRNARARIAHLVCEMAVRYGVTQGNSGIMFDFPVTQIHLADATGQTAVHVNRTIQSLRSEGLVRWRGHVITIPDWEALAVVGEFDPAYLNNRSKPEQRLRIMQRN